MKPSEDIKPITYMKTHPAELVETVSQRGRPMVITQNGVAKVVVQDVKNFERDRETLLFLKLIAQGVVEAQESEGMDQKKFFSQLEKKLTIKIK